MKISGWGRSNRQDCRVSRARGDDDVRVLAAEGRLIARGNGRSYGDAAQSRTNTVDMRSMNRMIEFDPATGQLVCEAGVMLADVIDSFLPRGWFPWVTPGTRFVTIGGMIAADVHGKNHHVHGSFGNFLDWIDLMDGSGRVLRCNPQENPDLFTATIGGMGLTGVILRAAFRLRRVETAWIRQETIAAPDLDTTLAAFETYAASTYSVAWIDCLAQGRALGRSLITLGEHATLTDLPMRNRAAPFAAPTKRKLAMPMDAPSFALNRWSIRAFNHLYYRRGAGRSGESLIGWEGYFYPLDAILNWNRLYGRRGFAQYQVVLPLALAQSGLSALLREIAASGLGSFLAVLKRLGPQGAGQMSFPMEGHTLALDFPASEAAFDLMRRLDDITIAHGGRHYLAKDSRLSPDMLRRTDPRSEAFRQSRRTSDFSSALSERLCL